MRVELAMEPAGRAPAEPIAGPSARRWRIDRFDLSLLGAFGVISLWVLALDAWQVVAHGRVWTGTDGVYIVDQMQYLAWIVGASRHLFSPNLFVLRPTPADYFQPAVAISGGLSALGIVPWLSLLLWKPVAVASTFLAVRAYVRRSLDGLWTRRVALVLALFFASFTVVYGKFTVLGDLFPGFLSWGYTFALLAVAAMVGAILIHNNARMARQIRWAPALLGATASLLHPWHGELLIVVIVGAELMMWRRYGRRGVALPAITIAGTALPLLYYAVLGKTDLSWELARNASKHSFSLWPILLYIAPLAIPALLAYRRPVRDFLDAATRAWPIAALAVFVVSGSAAGATPLHAFQGITIPLAVLAVQGIRQRGPVAVARRPALVWALLGVAVIPGTIAQLNTARELAAPTKDNANFIVRDEKLAVDYLASLKQPGGVLTRSYLGSIIPSRTGRRTLVGDCLWSQPHCLGRTSAAKSLFDGSMRPAAAQDFVRDSGARFLLADCEAKANLRRELGSMVLSVRHFGCASVVEVDAPGPPTGPLAESALDAVVRAQRRQ
jgi:hypothetical protein